MSEKELPILIYGAGGAAKEIYCCIKQINAANPSKQFNILGFVDTNSEKIGMTVFDNLMVVASDETISEYIRSFDLIGMVLSIGNPHVRSLIYEKLKRFNNVVFPNIIHPSVILNEETILFGQGNILTAGVILTCDIKIDNFNFINLACTIGHDTKIGSFNTINPLTALSGNVTIGDCCLVGSGSTIMQQITIEDSVTIGAGAVLTKDARKNETLIGVPARSIK